MGNIWLTDRELLESAMWEMRYEKLQNKNLQSLLDEVKTLLDKGIDYNIIEKVISNWEQRIMLDTIIHNKLSLDN